MKEEISGMHEFRIGSACRKIHISCETVKNWLRYVKIHVLCYSTAITRGRLYEHKTRYKVERSNKELESGTEYIRGDVSITKWALV